jgi:hypothetical protein
MCGALVSVLFFIRREVPVVLGLLVEVASLMSPIGVIGEPTNT